MTCLSRSQRRLNRISKHFQESTHSNKDVQVQTTLEPWWRNVQQIRALSQSHDSWFFKNNEFSKLTFSFPSLALGRVGEIIATALEQFLWTPIYLLTSGVRLRGKGMLTCDKIQMLTMKLKGIIKDNGLFSSAMIFPLKFSVGNHASMNEFNYSLNHLKLK